MTWNREDIEWAFIREFGHGDFKPSETHTSLARQEKVRIAIWREGRAALPFHDAGFDYQTAFRVAYGKPCEMRKEVRGAMQPLKAELVDGPDDDAGEDDEDGE
jgi:hypothetical protein